jgi:hypothetical protein
LSITEATAAKILLLIEIERKRDTQQSTIEGNRASDNANSTTQKTLQFTFYTYICNVLIFVELRGAPQSWLIHWSMTPFLIVVVASLKN